MAVQLYKPEEGQRVRNSMTAGIATLVIYGIYTLYHWLHGGWWSEKLPAVGDLFGSELEIDARLALALILLVGAAVAVYRLHNFPRWADFLIETEAEIRKVHWAPWKQVSQESLVVVVTVVILGIYIFGVDLVLITWQQRIYPFFFG